MNLNDLQTWHYGAIIGGAVLVLGFIVYFLPARKLKVPGVVLAGFGGLAAGLAIGIIWLAGFGYKPFAPEEAPSDQAGAPKEGGAPKGGPGGAPKGGPGGAPKGGFGGNAPGPRIQLVNLVTALDTIVDRPVSLTLTADDRAAIAAQLKSLSTGAISDDEAKTKLEAILKLVEKDRKALEAVGYRWPSPDGKAPAKGGPGGPPKDSPNPFADGQANERLKSLQERLDKK